MVKTEPDYCEPGPVTIMTMATGPDEEEYDTKIRVQSLALAVENSWPGQDLDEVMSRAIRFYNFLTRQVN